MRHNDSRSANLSYWLLAGALLGSIAFIATSQMSLQHTGRDIWQHMAALRGLADNLQNPTNPFVLSDESSRHYHPYWVGFAVLAQSFGWDVWTTLTVAGYAAMAVFGLGIFTFARTYFEERYAPHVLLLMLLFGWSVQIEHTGFHNYATLAYGAFYPATLLIGLSLLLWGVTLLSLRDARYSISLIPIVAFMFATHQLGAVIGFITAFWLSVLAPDGTFRHRVATLIAAGLGLSVAMLWPYHNPLTLMLAPGHSNWDGGPDFYGTAYLMALLVPAACGVLGLRDRKARPLCFALVTYTALYLFGLTGQQVAGRFIMPINLILQIGLTSFVMQVLARTEMSRRFTSLLGGVLGLAVMATLAPELREAWKEQVDRTRNIGVYHDAQTLTEDLPNDAHVAALGVTAWPIVALGRRVYSVPWPEPGISDLADRQDKNKRLFESSLSPEDRLSLAREIEVRVLLAHRSLLTSTQDQVLSAQSIDVRREGVLIRYDLITETGFEVQSSPKR